MAAFRTHLFSAPRLKAVGALFLVLALVFSIAAAPPAFADTSFADGEFNNGDWFMSANLDTATDNGSTAFQQTTGGNPGAFRRVVHNFTGPFGSGVVFAHLKIGAVYDPATEGAITNVAFAYDLIAFDAIATGAVAYFPLLEQGGKYYVASPSDLVLFTDTTWRSFARPVQTETSFDEVGPPVGNPDFSSSGSPITFGFATSNGTAGGTVHTESGIDNWLVQVTSQGPVGPGPPATLTLSPKADTNDVDTQHCVTATVTDAAGNPTPSITVRFSVTGSVNTSGSATTDANGEATFCYQGPELPGADAISAFADTDNDGTQDQGEPSDTATKLWTFPTSTPLCEANITQGGRITAANGDKATFGGNAQSDVAAVVTGEEEYQDHGPAQPQNVKSIQVLALTCNEERTQATVFGTATINGSGVHEFRIDVQDLGEPGVGRDTYRISLSTGYDSGVQKLKGGNVRIH
jgi:hypothetical protein